MLKTTLLFIFLATAATGCAKEVKSPMEPLGEWLKTPAAERADLKTQPFAETALTKSQAVKAYGCLASRLVAFCLNLLFSEASRASGQQHNFLKFRSCSYSQKLIYKIYIQYRSRRAENFSDYLL